MVKWLGETADLRTQMSPNLGTLCCLLANEGVTLRKVQGVISI
jgi:hypothetical protein